MDDNDDIRNRLLNTTDDEGNFDYDADDLDDDEDLDDMDEEDLDEEDDDW
jgi:hypothetical protein